MQDFAFLRHVTIGQYLPGSSVVHRLDPRTKITVVLLMTIAMMVNSSYMANLILIGIGWSIVRASSLPITYLLRGIRPAIPVLVALAIFQLLFMGNAPVQTTLPTKIFIAWGPFSIGTNGFQLVFVLVTRFLVLTLLASILTNTTPTSLLAHGIEDMLCPFRRIGVPAHEIALIAIIALRFVPILGEELEAIIKAQASRGADWGTRRRLKFVHTTRAILTVLIPLFVEAFRRAEELILAMEARCYRGGRGRTRLVKMHLSVLDFVVLLAFLLIGIGLIMASDRFPW